MKTIIVDDEIMAIKLVRNYLERDKRVEIVGECLDAGEALQCVRERAVEAAFLDICIHGCMDGVELGKKLKELNPQIVLIYTTGNAQYVDNAIDVEADFYLMKPLNAAELTFVVKKANELALQRNKRIFARTFGHFDLYIDGSPVMFRSAKAKELLANCDEAGKTPVLDEDDHYLIISADDFCYTYDKLAGTFARTVRTMKQRRAYAARSVKH